MTETLECPQGLPGDRSTTAPERRISAFVDEIRRSDAPIELALAIARRDAVLAAVRDAGLTSIRELVALEAGAFDARIARQPQPSPGAMAALRHLEAFGFSGEEPAPVADAELLHRFQRAHAERLNAGARSVPMAERTLHLLRRLMELNDTNRARIDVLGKAAASAHRVHRALQRWPIATVARLIETTGLQVQAVTSALHRLRGLGIVSEITRRHRHRLYCNDAWLALLDADVAAVLSEQEDAP